MRLKRFLCLLTLLCLAVSALPAIENRAEAEPKYYITVDITNQIVTVYDNGNTTDSGIVRQMICSTGKDATPTPTGTYTLPKKSSSSERTEWYYFSQYSCYAKWATRVVRGILFHSVLYTASKKGPTKSSVNALGSKASHGCIRLRVPDAQWIAQNCPAGTKCKIYKSGATNSALRKKLLSKSFSRDSQTYDAYMGRAAGSSSGSSSSASAKINLYKGKKGAQVKQLQNRLRALGFMGSAADGKFGSSTKTAVNKFRAACGLKQTGKVDNALWDKLFADDAPTSTIATLSQGWEGPAVKVLQQALADLKLYDGALDGVFGEGTLGAVRSFQTNYNLDVTGKANTALQNDAIAKAKSVKAQFGEAPYQLVTETNEISMAKVKVRVYTNLRSKASTKGKKVAKLYKNAKVKVLSDDGGKWTNVQYGSKTGYVLRKYLSFYTGTETTASYEAAPEPTPEDTPEPTAAPEVFIPEPASESEAPVVLAPALEIEPEVTPEPAAEPEPTPEPAAEPEPTPEPSVEPTAEPVGPADDQAEPAAEPARAPGYAVALSGGAKLYAAASAEAGVVGELAEGEALAVEAADGDWIAVRFGQGAAYVRANAVALADDAPASDDESAVEAGGEPVVEPGTEPADAPEPAEDPEDGNGLTVEYEQPE